MGFVEREAMPDEDARSSLRVQTNSDADLCGFDVAAPERNSGRVYASAHDITGEAANDVDIRCVQRRATLATRSAREQIER